MQNILITDKKVDPAQLKELCRINFGDMVKLVVDVEKKWLGIGGELHADAEELLLKNGSHRQDIWGCNFYPWHEPESRIEYTALINIRPQHENYSMVIQDKNIKAKVQKIVETDEKSLEKVKSEIQEILYNEAVDNKFQAWLEEIRKRAHIKIVK